MKIILIILAILIIVGIYKLIPSVFAAKGNAAYADGDVKKAIEFYEKAIKFSGGKPQHKPAYALMLMRTGNFEKAERLLNEVILYGGVKQNEKMNAKLFRCRVYQKTGRLDEALEDAEEIFESYKNTTVYGMICYLKQLKGGAELELCLEAYDYNSDDRDICDNLAVAYIRSGELAKAEEITAELREKFPNFVEGFYHSAVVAKLRGDKTAALEYLDSIEECRRTMMTTVSKEEINALRDEIENA